MNWTRTGIRSWLRLVWAMGVIVGGQAMAQESEGVNLPVETNGWLWDGAEGRYRGREIFDYIDGAGELYLSYGFRAVRVRRYTHPSHGSLTLELYDMGSSEDAYGVFSFEREDEEAGIGQGSEFGGGFLRFWKGRYFVSVYAEAEGPEVKAGVLEMGRVAAAAIVEEGAKPPLLAFLPGPEAGLEQRSVRFLRTHVCLNQRFFVADQNILRLGGGTGAVLARYRRGKGKAQMLLVQYADDERAQKAVLSFKEAYLPEAEERHAAQTEDGRWTVVERHGQHLAIVFGAATEGDGEDLLGAAMGKMNRR